MAKLLYIYQNYWRTYSSATLSILRGFEAVEGLKVNAFEIKPLSYHYNLNRVLNNLPFLRAGHFERQNASIEKKALNGSYDFLFVMKGTDLKAKTLERIRKKNPDIRLICFNPDDPFNMSSSNQEILKSIPIYDHYCIWTRHLDQKLKQAGAKDIIYFPFGVDDTIIYPVATHYKYELSFVGNGDAERHKIIAEVLQEIKERNLNITVHVFGNNWPKLDQSLEVHGAQYGNDLLETIGATKINLNLLRKQNKAAINMRTFEIPAAGGFMLHEESEEARAFFTKDEALYFSSTRELVDKIDYFLTNDTIREEMISKCLVKIKEGQFSYKKIIDIALGDLLN